MENREQSPPGDAAKRRMVELYSRVAPDYVSRGAPRFLYAGRRLVEVAGISTGDAVLDLGTGRGAVLLPAAERSGPRGRVVGVDLAEGMLEHTRADIARRDLHWATVCQMDAEQLEFNDSEFSHVLGSFVVFFFSDLMRALGEIRRVLRPGGVIGFAFERGGDPRWSWYEDLLRERGTFDQTPRLPENGGIRRPGALVKALEEAGFMDATELEEDVDLGYPDAETWWASLWTHGTRSALEALSSADLDNVKTRLMDRAERLAGPGGLPERHHLVYVTARKGVTGAGA